MKNQEINPDGTFEENTKAIRLKWRFGGGPYQSQIFFPGPTLQDALDEALEAGYALPDDARWNVTEAKRVRV